jgi:hypothetical protein
MYVQYVREHANDSTAVTAVPTQCKPTCGTLAGFWRLMRHLLFQRQRLYPSLSRLLCVDAFTVMRSDDACAVCQFVVDCDARLPLEHEHPHRVI